MPIDEVVSVPVTRALFHESPAYSPRSLAVCSGIRIKCAGASLLALPDVAPNMVPASMQVQVDYVPVGSVSLALTTLVLCFMFP